MRKHNHSNLMNRLHTARKKKSKLKDKSEENAKNAKEKSIENLKKGLRRCEDQNEKVQHISNMCFRPGKQREWNDTTGYHGKRKILKASRQKRHYLQRNYK